jgi:hypothetical protein
VSIHRHISPHPGLLPEAEGELFNPHLNFVNQSRFVGHTIFRQTLDGCSLSPRERVRVRGNEIFK